MTNATITAELLGLTAETPDDELRRLAKVNPTYHEVVLNFQAIRDQARYAEAIEFANLEFYTLADGSTVTKQVIFMSLYSKVVKASDNNPVSQSMWDIARRIQQGYKAQGVKLNLTSEGLREVLGLV
jgi:hypothetical protein